MHEMLKIRLELLNELIKFFNKNKIKYYVGGDILINIYNDIPIKNNVNFCINVIGKNIKNINELNSDSRIIKELFDIDGKKYYKFINKDTLFVNCNQDDIFHEKGIYITINLSSKDYNDYKEIKLNKIKVICPKDLDSYLENNYGLGYKYLKEKVESLPNSIIWSSEISYSEYNNSLEKNNIKINTQLFKDLKSMELKEKEYKKITDNYRNLVSRTDARYKLLKIYENKKSNIIDLYKNKKYKELGRELTEYLYEIKKYYDLNLGLCFDKDIFDITIDFLNYNNDKKLADWLLKNTPKQHLINIDFTYNDKVKNTQIKDLQHSFVNLLKKFDTFCKENNIIYYLEGGSILGAVRNEGFLPWDDDVDIVITSENYKKLVAAFEKKQIEGTKFVCIENNSNHTLYTGKLYDTSSSKVYYSYSLLDSTYGFHLDIIIMDHYLDNKYLRKIHNMLFYLYGQLLNPNELRYNVDITFYYKICTFIMKVIGRKNFLKILRLLLFNNKCKKSKYYKTRWQKSYKHKKELFKKQLYVPFENIELPIPIGYKEYLETVYGESWFVIPLEEDRMPSNRIFNLYVPYNLYQDDYMQFVDKKLTNKAYEKLKLLKMKKVKLIKQINKEKVYYQFCKDKLLIERQINIQKVNKLFNNNCFGEIREYLDKYYYMQLKGGVRDKNLIYISDKEFLYQAIYTLIMVGEFYDARKLLKIKKISDILQKEYNDLLQLIDDSKNISDKSNSEIKDLFKKYPYSITFYINYYKLIEDIKLKEKEVNKFNKLFPNNGETLYIYGLNLIENNKIEEGIEILKTATTKTRNGLIVLEINKLINKYEK